MTKPEHMVEEVLKTYIHMRAVKVLAASKTPLTKYQLVKLTGASPSTMSKIIDVFRKHQLITVADYKPVKYSLNRTPAVNKLLEFFAETRYV